MRVNHPVTQREFEFPADATLMSTTDSGGRITYANEAFVSVSGYPRDELTGQPHNIVRHPDMPREAFADMWATLKSGEPWTAIVKNRRKNGDHYWVRANAVPIIRGGRQLGYMSVRTKPTATEVADAEALYREFASGKAPKRKLHKGLVVPAGLAAPLALGKTLSVRGRIRLAMAAMMLAFTGAGWLLAGAQGLWPASGIGLGVAAALSWWFEVQLAAPLRALCSTALAVATGERRDVAQMNRTDEIGMTMRSISQLGLMFRWLVDDVSQQVVAVQAAVGDIAQGNNDLSSRTEQAAASVQQTAASMQQMTATVKTSSETAAEANQLSGKASAAASDGGKAVAEVVSTMHGISANSRRITDIIGVIDGIAFQTNILALNAAVEAARAGDQGRGFAVVAGEVRGLAQRSADAAKEIKQLIGASAQQVDVGARLVDDAGRTMQDIMAQVRHVSDLIGRISTATAEQASGITQVSDAVNHLDQITQQNAALAEQGTAASTSLREQAARLVDAVKAFQAT